MDTNDEIECSICLNTTVHTNDILIKPYTCCHTYHSQCINKWKKSCPMCRNRDIITVYDKRDIYILKRYNINYGDYIEVQYSQKYLKMRGIFTHIYKYCNKQFLHIENLEVYHDDIKKDTCESRFNILVGDPILLPSFGYIRKVNPITNEVSFASNEV